MSCANKKTTELDYSTARLATATERLTAACKRNAEVDKISLDALEELLLEVAIGVSDEEIEYKSRAIACKLSVIQKQAIAASNVCLEAFKNALADHLALVGGKA